jgi:hypothetical protein
MTFASLAGPRSTFGLNSIWKKSRKSSHEPTHLLIRQTHYHRDSQTPLHSSHACAHAGSPRHLFLESRPHCASNQPIGTLRRALLPHTSIPCAGVSMRLIRAVVFLSLIYGCGSVSETSGSDATTADSALSQPVLDAARGPADAGTTLTVDAARDTATPDAATCVPTSGTGCLDGGVCTYPSPGFACNQCPGGVSTSCRGGGQNCCVQTPPHGSIPWCSQQVTCQL